MKASEILTNVLSRIEDEKVAIREHNIRLELLMTISHMIKKNGYIEKKNVPDESLKGMN